MRGTNGDWSRRRVLIAFGGAGVTGIAGCSVLKDDDGSSDSDSPPGTEFGIEFDPEASNYTITYEGNQAFTEDNTGLLAIDHVTETGTADRMVWFGGPEFGPVEPGESTLWGYDTERVTALEVVWAPPESAGSGRAPDVLTRRSTP
ncbi:hypothetical protein L593_10115 [Salinarchaeum sp. Harcht-Bsk1]|uniref:hypothetical protein n=1 Tax=Salinarchaeum sp. Harcht-Bsk1 TaxID=1333523 RepID=UPI00034241B6|nr:hypothetical protein [Salinarchaeum sp. Harcht-Bsk1]AGN01968.1 hypothetical protein L593_10115 [Salinarchaeum sp. Harcht-Bsk1]